MNPNPLTPHAPPADQSILGFEDLCQSAYGEAGDVLTQIAAADEWLAITLIPRSVSLYDELAPILFRAVKQWSHVGNTGDLGYRRIAAFGFIILAESRERAGFEHVVRTLEMLDARANSHEYFHEFLKRGNLLLAGCSPMAAQPLFDVGMNENLKPRTRGLAIHAIAVLVSWGDICRAEAIRWLRQMFLVVQEMNEAFTTTYWGIAAGAIAISELKRELQWILKSELLSQNDQELLSACMRSNPINVFHPDFAYCREGHIFHNLFPKEVRGGECGYLVKAPMPEAKSEVPSSSASNASQSHEEQKT